MNIGDRRMGEPVIPVNFEPPAKWTVRIAASLAAGGGLRGDDFSAGPPARFSRGSARPSPAAGSKAAAADPLFAHSPVAAAFTLFRPPGHETAQP